MYFGKINFVFCFINLIYRIFNYELRMCPEGEKMDAMFFCLEFAVVLTCIFIGARMGGLGLGVMGGLGMVVLVFGFGAQPQNPPVDVMLIILSVVTAASTLQAAGGMD